MVYNAETYLKTLLQPLVDECEYSIRNQKNFKKTFLQDRLKFNSQSHRVVTVDVTKMYSNINVVRVISIILDKIYANPKKFFNFKTVDGSLLPPPKRENLKQLFLKTLQKFTKVRTPVGIYQQLSGLCMGSALSPLLANILVNDLEQKIVKKFIDTGKVLHYSRFVDDSLIIIRKNALRQFLKQINSFDHLLNFTCDEMDSHNKINFLDMTIFIDDQQLLQFIKYRKDSVDTVLSNFKQSISAQRYLKGGINTVLHREYVSCSTDKIFQDSLIELKEVYARNSYPTQLINSKIKIFLAQLNCDSEKPLRQPYDYTVVLEYTSPLIESNIYELSRKISQFIPNFNLNVAFRTVKVKKLFSFQAKGFIDKFDRSNVVYEFDCVKTCAEFYIGETGRTLITRVKEHMNGTSNICEHIEECEKYKVSIKNFVRENKKEYPDPDSARLEFFKNRFKILEKNFKSDFDREKSEAFLIRTKRPKINDQFDSKAFKLF